MEYDYEEMVTRFRVNGLRKGDPKKDLYLRTGMKAYNKYAHFANRFFIPVYNKIWYVLYPNTKDWVKDHPNYDKLYYKISSIIANSCALFLGGYNWKENKKVWINPLFNFKDPDENGIWTVDDMLYVRDIFKRKEPAE